VALARALALRPDVLLLDEPTAGVDPKNIATVERTIISFAAQRRLTVVWVTHNVEQARRVSDRVAALRDGVVTAVAPPDAFSWEGIY
jgi:ABC-type transporter Mla maintaining outer membrane lipid asymmetry ATPase subunit MlaF